MEVLKKYGLVFLSLLLLFPSAITFGHIFTSHEHKVCNNHNVHFHEQDVDCDIFNFKQNPTLVFSFQNFSVPEFVFIPTIYPETYQFLSDYQKLAFVLRGPPYGAA